MKPSKRNSKGQGPALTEPALTEPALSCTTVSSRKQNILRKQKTRSIKIERALLMNYYSLFIIR